MENKHMERFSSSLAFKKMQIKTIRMAKVNIVKILMRMKRNWTVYILLSVMDNPVAALEGGLVIS